MTGKTNVAAVIRDFRDIIRKKEKLQRNHTVHIKMDECNFHVWIPSIHLSTVRHCIYIYIYIHSLVLLVVLARYGIGLVYQRYRCFASSLSNDGHTFISALMYVCAAAAVVHVNLQQCVCYCLLALRYRYAVIG